ncbi:MAG: 50S ribosomal protein L19 [Candidatus Moranbacteria bacterium]|nr:50S ribosomal protein L19 [Candidatus Moranbacteria bacterium]
MTKSIKEQLKPGDVVEIKRKVTEEGDKERIQVIEGTVIARKHGNETGATITIRKIASGVGAEFIFPLNSPLINQIKVIKRSKTRRAKLYYIRDKTGKSAKLKESKKINETLNIKEKEKPQQEKETSPEEKNKKSKQETKPRQESEEQNQKETSQTDLTQKNQPSESSEKSRKVKPKETKEEK